MQARTILPALLCASASFAALDAQAQAYNTWQQRQMMDETVVVWPRQGNTQFISRSGRPDQTIFYMDGSQPGGYGYGGYCYAPSQDLINYGVGFQGIANMIRGLSGANAAPAPIMPHYAPNRNQELANELERAAAAQSMPGYDPEIAARLRWAQEHSNYSEVDTSDIEGY